MRDKELEVYEVNLAVSNICNASCIYCPRSFVTHKDKFMSPDLVEKIMSEVGGWKFKSRHPVVHSSMAENGEPFLNPDIIDLLKIVRGTVGHPGNKLSVAIFSNCSLLNEDLSEKIIGNHLIDSLNVNIDGFSHESYYAVKGLNLENTEENVKSFIRIRDKHGSPIRVLIHVISHYTYTEAVKKAYGINPIKGNGHYFPQDGHMVVEKWKKIINPSLDGIGEGGVLFWAERYNNKPISVEHGCPNIGRVRHVAYINPSGDWYACCFDMGNDLVVGNINESSLLDISMSEKRRNLISMLDDGKLKEIGFPCTRVDSCSSMGKEMIS